MAFPPALACLHICTEKEKRLRGERQSKPKQQQWTESTRQKGWAGGEERAKGTRAEREMSKGGRVGAELLPCISNRSLRGHEEHMAGLRPKAMKVSVVTAMCCFWEGHLLPQRSLAVSDNSPAFQSPRYELGPGVL